VTTTVTTVTNKCIYTHSFSIRSNLAHQLSIQLLYLNTPNLLYSLLRDVILRTAQYLRPTLSANINLARSSLSLGTPNRHIRHLQRQLDQIGLDHLWGEIDRLIQQAIKAILARSPGDLPKDPNPDLIAIPVRKGGLGIPLYKDLARGLFQAAKEASEPLLEKIRASSQLPYTPSRDPSLRIRKTAQGVLKDTNRARLACFLKT
jgi:hypothetical protein